MSDAGEAGSPRALLNATMGFEYLQERPVERFRIPDRTDPISACALLLSFAAYPLVDQLSDRQHATDAFRAWILRMSLNSGAKVKPPPNLTRKHLAPALMRRRVYRASQRIEDHGLDLVGLAMDMTFFRSGGPSELAALLGQHFGAEQASVKVPGGVNSDVGFLKRHLACRKSRKAMDDEHIGHTLQDFRRRSWRGYLPALPLLTAIHVDCLKYNFHTAEYGVTVPGFPRRYLAIALMHNPQIWVGSVVTNARVRRAGMVDHFAPHSFPEILGEQPTPPWLNWYETEGYQIVPSDKARKAR